MKEIKGDVSRRDFHKLTLAAFGGILAGSVLGGGRPAWADEKANMAGDTAKDAHACCGLNTCKGLGAGGKNECAGTGSCSTAAAHGCAGENACKGQGGAETAGTNACKGKGACGVPVTGESWTKARANFESVMKKAGKSLGPAPASCGKVSAGE